MALHPTQQCHNQIGQICCEAWYRSTICPAKLTLVLISLLAGAVLCPLRAPGQPSRVPVVTIDAGGHHAQVRTVRFTPDGRQLISVSTDKTIRIWDVKTGETVRVLRPPIGEGRFGALYSAAISPDGRRLAVGGYTKWDEIYLIALPEGKVERILDGHRNVISDLTFSHDGRWLASASSDRLARIWDIQTGRCVRILRGHRDGVCGVMFSPDASRIVTTSFDHTGRLWSVDDGRQLALLEGHRAYVQAVAWSDDGQTIATGSNDCSIRLWDADGGFRRTFSKLPDWVSYLEFTPDGQELFHTVGGVGRQGGGYFLDLNTGRSRLGFGGDRRSVFAGALSPDGELVATSSAVQKAIHIWRKTDGSLVHELAAAGRCVWSCGWEADGRTIAFGQRREQLGRGKYGPLQRSFRFVDLHLSNEAVGQFQTGTKSRGDLELVVTDDRQFAVKRSGRVVATLQGRAFTHDRKILSVSLVGQKYAAIGTVFGLYLFDTGTGKSVRRFKGHNTDVWAVAGSPDGRYLLSASADQTVRVWRPDRDKPLVSLFFTADDWVAWTPQGYYACSPGGERLMGWHVNGSPDELASFYPAENFRNSLYRPDVIQLLLEAGSVAEAVRLADERRGATTGESQVADVLPPRVRILAPDISPHEVAESRVTIRAAAWARAGAQVNRMQLLINGRPYPGPAEQAAPQPQASLQGAVGQSWQLDLPAGVHDVVVKAETSSSFGLSDALRIIHAPEQRTSRLFVLAIGVSQHKQPKYQLKFPAEDARAVAAAFETASRDVFQEVRASVLTDQQATRAAIIRGIESLQRQMTPSDTGIIFYSGHGMKAPGGEFCLLPFDCDPERITIDGVDEEDILSRCRAIRGRLVVLLDACHAGTFGDQRSREVEGMTDNLIRRLQTEEYGVVVLASSASGELAWENAAAGHGAFTAALLAGLKRKADLNQDGAVHLKELAGYVRQEVAEMTSQKQHPVSYWPAGVRSFELTRWKHVPE